MKILKNTILTIVTLLLFSVLFSFLFYVFFCGSVVVKGSSMEPTLKSGELGIFIKKGNVFSNVGRDDIVIFEGEMPLTNGKDILIKRVIGKPGDHVEIKPTGAILVNDQEIAQNYLDEEQKLATYQLLNIKNMNVTLGSDEYYVLGDNRLVSYDSRYFGPIKDKDIRGKFFISYGHYNNFDESSGKGSSKSYFPIRFFERMINIWNF